MKWKELLILAKSLIATPTTWCQKTFAKKNTGDACAASNPEACQWCAAGAAYRARMDGLFTHEERIEGMRRLGVASLAMQPGWSLVDINDRGTHAEVMEMFERAINE